MKKMFCMGLLLLSALASNAQKRYMVWANSTPNNIDAIFFGDNAGTCTPNFQTTAYPMVPSNNADATTASWTGSPSPTPNVFNGVRLVYKVLGVPVSTFDIDFCSATPGTTAFTFPGGPSMRYQFLSLPSNYELIIVP
jgi:hypothetical protein